MTEHAQATSGGDAEEIYLAIERREFFVRYLPKLALDPAGGGVITGAEALVRWRHPELGELTPSRFLGRIAEAGLMTALTDQVIQAVAADMRDWSAFGITPTVGVNLSPCLLTDPDFAERMSDIVRDEGLTPARLTFDVPADAVTEAEAAETLTQLRLKGFGLSADDFGLGASSLTQLYRLPFNEIKIDLAVVTDAPADPEAETICRALVRLAHEFGMTACAEGVETAETLAYLTALGCDMAQGYFIDRPLLADEVALRFGAFVDTAADIDAYLTQPLEAARLAF